MNRVSPDTESSASPDAYIIREPSTGTRPVNEYRRQRDCHADSLKWTIFGWCCVSAFVVGIILVIIWATGDLKYREKNPWMLVVGIILLCISAVASMAYFYYNEKRKMKSWLSAVIDSDEMEKKLKSFDSAAPEIKAHFKSVSSSHRPKVYDHHRYLIFNIFDSWRDNNSTRVEGLRNHGLVKAHFRYEWKFADDETKKVFERIRQEFIEKHERRTWRRNKNFDSITNVTGGYGDQTILIYPTGEKPWYLNSDCENFASCCCFSWCFSQCIEYNAVSTTALFSRTVTRYRRPKLGELSVGDPVEINLDNVVWTPCQITGVNVEDHTVSINILNPETALPYRHLRLNGAIRFPTEITRRQNKAAMQIQAQVRGRQARNQTMNNNQPLAQVQPQLVVVHAEPISAADGQPGGLNKITLSPLGPPVAVAESTTMPPVESSHPVYVWLAKLKLQQYFDRFIDEGYDEVETIKHMSREDLREIEGMKKGHALKIAKAIANQL